MSFQKENSWPSKLAFHRHSAVSQTPGWLSNLKLVGLSSSVPSLALQRDEGPDTWPDPSWASAHDSVEAAILFPLEISSTQRKTERENLENPSHTSPGVLLSLSLSAMGS